MRGAEKLVSALSWSSQPKSNQDNTELSLEDIGVCTPSMETEKSHVSEGIDYTTATVRSGKVLTGRQKGLRRIKMPRISDGTESKLYTVLLARHLVSG